MRKSEALALDADYQVELQWLEQEAAYAKAERERERQTFRNHFETDDESREEMERDEARHGSFGELMRG